MKEIGGLSEFLEEQTLMALRPSKGKPCIVSGLFRFSAEHLRRGQIDDAFELEIEIPISFPKQPPTVRETGGRIPRSGEYHVNEGDCSLCLGSPLRLLGKLSQNPTLLGFTRSCIVPYLFAASFKLANGGSFPFGELAHGSTGELDDYMEIFQVDSHEKVLKTLGLVGLKKRVANKLPCPCGCGKRLGRCSLNRRISDSRRIASRAWFRSRHSELSGGPVI